MTRPKTPRVAPRARVAALGTSGGAGTHSGHPPLPSPTSACPEFTEGMQTFTANGEARTGAGLDRPRGRRRRRRTPRRLLVCNRRAAVAGNGRSRYGGHQSHQGRGWSRRRAGAQQPGHISLDPGRGKADAFMDEIVGCAKEKVGIDVRRIHRSA